MNSKLLLVHAITLMYRESQLSDIDEKSSTLVREILQIIPLPGLSMGFNHERDILEGLKSTALYMCEVPQGYKYELSDILQRLKINTLEEETLYEALVEGISPELTEDAIKRVCLNLRRTLNTHFKEEKLAKIVSEAAYKFKFSRNKITNMKAFVSELSTALEPYMVDAVTKDPAIISDVDVCDVNQITNIFNEVRKSTTGIGILKTGWQGLNRMLNGGFRRGEQTVIGALQHKYKTGFSLTLFKQMALYNIPVMINKTKKPLLLRISFEDNLTLNFQFLYQSLKENETGLKADLAGVTDTEMAAYVQEKLSVSGYHTRLMFVNPSLWTYKDVCNKILELEADGYEIHMLMVDYLLKLPTTGCDQGPMGHDIRNMYERIRSFCTSRGIAFITPHQLSTDAKMMAREGRSDFVKSLISGGFYSGSKQIDQVVDLEIFIHIETLNNVSYLTIQRGKHRIIEQTPAKDQYMVLAFNSIGGIPDDLLTDESTRYRVGGETISSGKDMIPYWERDSFSI